MARYKHYDYGQMKLLLWHRLLGRPVSEYGRLCHGNGGHEWGDRHRRALMLAILKDCEGARTHNFPVAAVASRRGDRVSECPYR